MIGFAVGLAVAVVVAGVFSPSTSVMAQRTDTDPTAGAGHPVLFSSTVDAQRQLLTVFDPETLTLCVYHVENDSGEISLKSARNLTWDMQMVEFNGKSPLPQEIRSMLQRPK
ncbi:MAG: hypothetical protein R3C10_24760 [Pirellulales bacterium]|nr:hypothetical protein [Planctomycetales bacterium]